MKKIMMAYVLLVAGKFADRILTIEQLKFLLWEEEADAGGPGGLYHNQEPSTDDDINSLVKDLSGKSIREYCEWRWPGHPEDQYLIVLNSISRMVRKAGNVYAVVHKDIGSVTENLSYEEAENLSRGYGNFMVPMEALNIVQ